MKHFSTLRWVSLAILLAVTGFGAHASSATLALASNVLTYTPDNTVANSLSVTISGSNFVFNDTAETISTSIAGSTGNGTNTVNVPYASVTGLVLNLGGTGFSGTISSAGVISAPLARTITAATNSTTTATITTSAVHGFCVGQSVTIAGVSPAGYSGTFLIASVPSTTTFTYTSSGLGTATLTSPTATGPAATAITINNAATNTGTLTFSGPISTTGNVSISAANAIALNNNILAGSGTVTINANTAGSGSSSLTQAQTGSTITTTSTSASAVSITVNTSGGSGTGNAILRTISAVSGTLTIAANGGSILYAGTDTLDVQQAALSTLAPGILGPVASGTGQGGSGAAPAGTINAKTYLLSTATTGSTSIGTAARPIQSFPTASNGVTLTTGSGGVYFVDWGAVTLTLNSASAQGAGNIVVVAANASGHNLTVAGNVSTASGNIVLAADDTFTVNAAAIVGGASFSGDVYLACNRDTGNGDALAMSGTVTTSNTSASAVVIEGFHMAGNGTNTSTVTVNNVTVGNGGTITVSGVPASLPTGQGAILATNASSVLNAGVNGTVKFIATTVASTTSTSAAVGTAAIPMTVTAGNVIVIANSGTFGALTSYPDTVYVTDTIGGNFTATTGSNSPGGDINLTTTSGVLTVNGATNTGVGGAINLTSTGTGGGIAINAPLGGSTTGNITLNAGTNAVTLNTLFAPASTSTVNVTAGSGFGVSSTGTVDGSLNSIGNLSIATGGIFRVDVNSNTAFDSLNVTGTVNITGSTLQFYVDGPITTGTSFTLINNDLADAVVGQFAGGTTPTMFTAVNDPSYVFTINYAGGDGNDVVGTVQANTTLDVTGGVVTYSSVTGVNNNLTVTRSSGNYTFTDPSTTIALSPGALAALWTGSGTNTVTGPIAGITNLTVRTNDGTDTIAGIDAGAASVNISGFGTINVSGVVSTTSTITVSGLTDLSISGTGLLQGTTLTLTTSNSLGTSLQSIATQATAIVASTGPGSMFITEADGTDVTASASSTGNVTINNLLGTLNVAGTISTVSGNISLSSADDITLNANVNSGSGTVTIAANTDGVGAGSLTQNATAATSTITSASGVTITVNTAGGGTGSANLRTIACAAANLVVNTNGGSILYAGVDALDIQQAALTTLAPGITGPAPSGTGQGGTGSAPSGTLVALNYILSTSGSGSIGTAARPIQTTAPASNVEVLTAGNGGIYFVDWGSPLTLNGATATGAGNVVVVAANAGGHNLVVAGSVSTGSGNIVLAADDDFTINSGITIGGAGFSGDVYCACNRDTGNGENLTVTGSIVTSNNSASAVVIEGFHAAGNGTDSGSVIVNNITVGDGGKITVSTVPSSLASGQGTIQQGTGTVLNAGPTGTVAFIATTMAGNATFTSAVGTSTTPITVTAGNVTVTAKSGTSGALSVQADSVFITDTIAGNFTVTTGNTSPSGSINLTTTSGVLTINGATNTGNSNAINLTGAAGVAINAPLGNSTTGAMTINAGTNTATLNSTMSLNASQALTVTANGGLTIGAAGVLRGTGAAANSFAVTESGGAVWPGSASAIASLSSSENLSVGTYSLSGAKLQAILKYNGGGANVLAQKITATATSGTSVTLGTGSVLSFTNDANTTTPQDYLVLDASANPTGFTTSFAGFLAVNSATQMPLNLGTDFDIVYKSAVIDSGEITQSSIGLGATLASAKTQVYVRVLNTGVTPVTIGAFTAEQQGAGVLLSWNCVSEFQNAGFNVYRRAINGSDWARVNPALISGRITNADSKSYSIYDWAPNGSFEYRLESVSLKGLCEDYPSLAGPVTLDSLDAIGVLNLDGLEAMGNSFIVEASHSQALAASAAFARVDAPNAPENDAMAANTSVALARDAQGSLVLPATIRDVSANRSAAGQLASANAASTENSNASAVALASSSPVAAARWFSSTIAASSSSTAVKVQYVLPGVLAIPQASLPVGFDVHHVTIQRAGVALPVLALKNNTLYVYAPGYIDDYTNTDALFVRSTSAPTAAGSVALASGLFSSAQQVNSNTPSSVTHIYHDVYFDYNYGFRPFTFPPWFSSEYLTDGTDQSFTLNTPFASSGPASLTVTLWSLTSASGVSPDHALQVVINGQPVGQAQWSGGGKMMQLSFQVPSGVLSAGSNQIDLVTPELAGVGSQTCFLNTLTMNYTRALDGSQPVTLTNANTATQLFELSNVPSANEWIVDLRYPDRAALVPYEAQAQNDGTYNVRFNAASGGTGQYLVVPFGQENQPVSVAKCSVKPIAQAAYLAVGPSQFSAGVQSLLMKHSKEGLRSAFVDQEQLFDYYNYGRYGPVGIQNAVRSVRPQYLLLVGRTTYDYLNYSGANVDPLCPAFLVSTTFWSQTTSDSMFGDLGNGYPQVAVGRLPINNTTELAGAVQNVLSNSGAPISGIRVQATADQADPAAGDFPTQAAGIAQALPDLSWQANYLGVTYQTPPEVTTAMTTAANGGADWLVYVGHGNAVGLGNESPQILNTNSVQNWTGHSVFLQSTCTANWMAKDVQDYKSIAIQALTQPQGGISASIGTSTYMSSDYAVAFMTQLMKTANTNGMRWGDALMKTQQWASQQGQSYYDDLNRTEQIFGDPAMAVFQKSGAASTTNSGATPPATGSAPATPQTVAPGQF